MSLTLAASQDALSKRADVVPARLFHLTTYSDRELGTVDREFWWSHGAPWRYEWGAGAAREFDDVVLSASPIEYAMEHLPSPGRVDVRRTSMRLELTPEDIDGQSLWKTIASDALLFSRLEVATLLIEPERLVPGTAWWDLRDLAGTEHVVRFRGELTAVESVSDDGIVIVFEGEEPNLDWPEALDEEEVDLRDVGRRYAIPFGRAKGVPCVNRRVGWETTLATELTPSQTGNADVTNAAGLPLAGSFTLQLGGERVTATYVDDDTVNISARGVGGTVATAHPIGESILEVLSSVVIVAAGVPCKALDALYVIDPATREKVKVATGYTVDLDDRDVDPGRRLTTVTFTQSEHEEMIDKRRASSGDAFKQTAFNKFVIASRADGDTSAAVNADGLGIRLNGSAGSTHEGKWTIDAAALPAAMLGYPISRLRVKAVINGEGDTLNDAGTNQKTNFRMQARYLLWDDSSGTPVNNDDVADYTFETGAQESGVALESAWYTPFYPKTGANLSEIEVRFWLLDATGPSAYASDNWAFVFAGSVVVEVEFASGPLAALGSSGYGWGMEFVADVQGVMVPFSFAAGYGFDEGAGWSTAGGMTQSDQSGIQRFTSPALSLITDSAGACDSAALWNNNNATLTDDTTTKTQGTGSVKITPTGAGSQAEAERNFTANADWTNKAIAIDLYPSNAGHINTTEGIRVRFEDAGGDWRAWDFGTADGIVLDAWNTVVIDPTQGWDEKSGTFNIDVIDRIRVVANKLQNSASNTLRFDNIRIINLSNSLIPDVAGSCDDLADWIVQSSSCTLALDTSLKTQGAASIRSTPTNAANPSLVQCNFDALSNWTGKRMSIDIYPTHAGHVGTVSGIGVRIEDGGSDWRQWNFGTNDGIALDQWNTIIIDPTTGFDSSSGVFNIDNIDKVRVIGNGLGNSIQNVLWYDNVRLIDPTTGAIAQRNATAAAIDLTGARYRTRVKATNANRIDSLIVSFSNTAGVGTTAPASYRTVTIPGADLTEGEWIDAETLPSDVGAPGVNNIETVRVEIVRNASGVEAPSVDIDAIDAALATNADWDGATAGALLEAGPDAIRYLIGEFAGVGAANVLGVATAKTNLGADVFAGNLCALGTEFGTVLARLAFETRTNVVRREGASATQYQLLAASTAYAFPAATLTLEELSGLRESLRAASEIATHFRIHYGVELADAQLAQNESAFRAMLRADPSVNDLTTPSTATLAAAAAALGRRDSGPIYLLMTQAEATAKDVAGYYAAESVAYARRRWSLASPLWEAYAVEPGDVAAFTPRWASGAVKARVVGVTVDLADPSIGLALEEVL